VGEAALECVVLIGLPAAGKTTFYRTYFAATHAHLSKDLWPNATRREARQRALLAETLSLGRSVVIDNTNLTVVDRAALLAIAHAGDARAIAYFFNVTTREAAARNAAREGRAKVPNVAIFTGAKRLEAPTLAEGFDQLFELVLTPERTWNVTEITLQGRSA